MLVKRSHCTTLHSVLPCLNLRLDPSEWRTPGRCAVADEAIPLLAQQYLYTRHEPSADAMNSHELVGQAFAVVNCTPSELQL